MNSGQANKPPGQNRPAASRGQTRPAIPRHSGARRTPSTGARRAGPDQGHPPAIRRRRPRMGDRQTDPRHRNPPRRPQGLPARHDPLLLRRPRATAHLRRPPRAPRPTRPHPPRAARRQQQRRANDRAAQPRPGPRSLPGQLRPTDRGATDARTPSRAGRAVARLDRQAHRDDRRAKSARGGTADHDPYALALLWSSLTAGLAAHHLADPEIELQPALDLAQRYATSLR